jgi:pheromone a factor receptor
MLLGLIVFSVLAALLVLVPLPWQWRLKNYPVICLIIWLFIYNITTAVNAILWSGTAQLQYVAWCEIGEH